jgi:hypothetical protein
MKFRTIPQVIDAFRFWLDKRPDWFTELVDAEKITITAGGQGCVFGSVHEPGVIRTANAGDWIVRDADGELHAFKPDIFGKTFERDLGPDPRAVMNAARRLLDAFGPEDTQAALADLEQLLDTAPQGARKPGDGDALEISLSAAKKSELVIVTLNKSVTTISLDYDQAMDLSAGIRDKALQLRGITE